MRSSKRPEISRMAVSLHIVGQEPLATERKVAQLVVDQPELQQLYGGWMASLHSSAWEEVEVMVRKAGKGLNIELEPAIQAMGGAPHYRHGGHRAGHRNTRRQAVH
jgi:hypothetical protein